MIDTLIRLACALVPALYLLVLPEDGMLRLIWRGAPLRTWHLETLAVAAFIAAIVIASGNAPVEWVGFAALVLAHGRNSIMFRLTEAQRLRSAAVDPHVVECWRWSRRYFLAAEAFWALYFVAHRSWAALCGVVVFVGYAQWREWRFARRGQAPVLPSRRRPDIDLDALEGRVLAAYRAASSDAVDHPTMTVRADTLTALIARARRAA